ncbi:YfiM family protein [Flavobacterium sp. N1994]|uniref:YfiM family protein n=1 Tax=Flavobacterium sp. N1994 TaxID=2986827 RepID=UPI002221916D|nr:YfiM family protein [Flavobacterium sp. N1994]
MKVFKSLVFTLLLWCCQISFGQSAIDNFLKPSDTLSKKRLKTLVISESVIGTATLVGLNQLWYADYPRSNFHFINDNAEWLQMDKVGHVFSSYHLGSFGANTLKWTGASRKSQLIYGSTLGLAFMTTVEVFDGYSANWGASLGDVAANVAGTALYVSQELLWKEQRIVPKFSFHTTPYASARPNVLGSSVQEQILKDYNGQTYWLSANIYSFAKSSSFPKWLNIAIGYGAEGMITGDEGFTNSIFLPESKRFRQFYLSLDVDLTKIKTKSHLVKTILTVFNSIKIPAPTFEIKGSGGTQFHILYF